ncbi:MAG: lysophospholipase [Rudaea sp.]|uniref:alpha/beta hydrolase n=1 Tax=unclassified Rudaea TaxID=2627037 RepID=UPI0010F67B00|nr:MULTISPECIES: alpha/beta hydrolase [unclassified Rudaea]MBN8888587.1 lysophospholipase [Rudaea sp.]
MSVENVEWVAADGARIAVHRWSPRVPPRAVLLVAHGMAEHGARYARFAAALNERGWMVYALDHLGHGLTAANADARGFFAERDGWARALAALDAVCIWAAERHADLPLCLFGHSMGSFLSQHYLVEHGEGLAAAILSATSASMGPLRPVGHALMRAEAALFGAHHPSALADILTFRAFNKAFDRPDAPARTAFDWLSRDASEVDKYIADPLCGFRCSARLWADLLGAGANLTDARRLARIPKSLPILLIAGAADPVSGEGRGTQRLAEEYRYVGATRIEVKIYPDARHELLNDTCRDEATADVLAWLDRAIST